MSLAKTKFWISICLNLFGIVTIIIAIFGYFLIYPDNSTVQDFKYNWKLQPISDIITTTGDCPYEYEDLLVDTWPGTKAGCYCKTRSSFSNRVKQRPCRMKDHGCIDIEPINSIPLNHFYSSRICGKRIEETFVNAVIPESKFFGVEPSCQTGYKFCGGTSKPSWICVRNQENCPLNDISIEQLADPSAVPEGYSAQPLGDGYYVLFTSNANKAPIARLKIAAGKVCVVPSQFDYPLDRKLYPLLDINGFERCSSNIGGYNVDPRFELVASINEQRLFDDNKVTPSLGVLPEYDTADGIKYNWNLYSNRFYEWSDNCGTNQSNLELVSKSEVIEAIDDSEYASNKLYSVLIICAIQFVVCCIVINSIIIRYSYTDMHDGSHLCMGEKCQSGFETAAYIINSLLLILKVCAIRLED